MSRLLACLGRFAAILSGFICACLAASMVLHMLALGGSGWLASGRHVEATMWFSVVFATALIGSFSFIPAVILIVIAEIASARGWLAYALSGGGVALLSGFMMRASGPAVDSTGRNASPTADFSLAMVAAGMIGGLVYWLVCGRSAGLWIERTIARTR